MNLGDYRLDIDTIDGFLLLLRVEGCLTNDDLLALQHQIAKSHERYRFRVWDLRDASFEDPGGAALVGSRSYAESRGRHVVVVGSSPEVVELQRVHKAVFEGSSFELAFDLGEAVDRLRAVYRAENDARTVG